MCEYNTIASTTSKRSKYRTIAAQGLLLAFPQRRQLVGSAHNEMLVVAMGSSNDSLSPAITLYVSAVGSGLFLSTLPSITQIGA